MHDASPEAIRENTARAAAITIQEHNDRARYVIDDKEHGMVMLMVDLLGYADKNGIDMKAVLADAYETYAEITV